MTISIWDNIPEAARPYPISGSKPESIHCTSTEVTGVIKVTRSDVERILLGIIGDYILLRLSSSSAKIHGR